MAKSPTQRVLHRRKQRGTIVWGQGMHKKQRRAEQPGLGNGKDMELKLIKHDGEL